VSAAGVLDVGKARPRVTTPPTEEAPPSQYNVRIGDAALERRLYTTARTLGLDGANFLRMMIRECLPIYERRAEAINRGEAPAG
jgi:hypothetical protein